MALPFEPLGRESRRVFQIYGRRYEETGEIGYRRTKTVAKRVGPTALYFQDIFPLVH